VCRFRVAASKAKLGRGAIYKLFEAVAKPVCITFSRHCLLFSWTINLGFLTEGKLAAIFIKTFSWGSPTIRSITTSQQVSWHHHHRAINKFSGAVAGEEWKTSARGVFRTHILYFVYCFALLYLFYLHCFISKTQKN
jgi:hypothetical protein